MFCQKGALIAAFYLRGHTSLVKQKLKVGPVKWGGGAVLKDKAGINVLNAGKNSTARYLNFLMHNNRDILTQ